MSTQGDLSKVKCYICKQFGHRKGDCPQFDPNYRKKVSGGSKVSGASKWCSLHKTASHSDDECMVQQKNKDNKGSANFTNIYHPRQSTSPEDTASEMAQGFQGGFSFAATTTEAERAKSVGGAPIAEVKPKKTYATRSYHYLRAGRLVHQDGHLHPPSATSGRGLQPLRVHHRAGQQEQL